MSLGIENHEVERTDLGSSSQNQAQYRWWCCFFVAGTTFTITSKRIKDTSFTNEKKYLRLPAKDKLKAVIPKEGGFSWK